MRAYCTGWPKSNVSKVHLTRCLRTLRALLQSHSAKPLCGRARRARRALVRAMSKVRAYCSASDHLIRKIFSGVCRVSHWFEEYLKIIEIGDYFFEWTFIFRVFHPSNMPGSHPLWATFVWPIAIQVHCKNQSSSMTTARDKQGNRLCSSLIKWVPVIGSVDKIACSRGQKTNLTGWSTPLMRCLTLSSEITCLRREAWVCTIPRHERDSLWSISRTRDLLELWFSQWTRISMCQTKAAQRGCDPGLLEGWKTRKMNVHSKK